MTEFRDVVRRPQSQPRIVIKMRGDLNMPPDHAMAHIEGVAKEALGGSAAYDSLHPTIEPTFSMDPKRRQELFERARARVHKRPRHQPPPDLGTFYTLRLELADIAEGEPLPLTSEDVDAHVARGTPCLGPDGTSQVGEDAEEWTLIERILRALREDRDNVELAYVESPVAASSGPTRFLKTGDKTSDLQPYLNPRSQGIGVRELWERAYEGRHGEFARVVDVESGWITEHPDLPDTRLIWGVSKDEQEHGLQVLGVLGAQGRATGILGVSPKAKYFLSSTWKDGKQKSPATAIMSAIEFFMDEPDRHGDVLLVEVQAPQHVQLRNFRGSKVWVGDRDLPAEAAPAVFGAIRNAVDLGIVVVEAAANGPAPLNVGESLFTDPCHPAPGLDFLDKECDSGAIIVAAGWIGGDTMDFVPVDGSNYGTRIDCFGPGNAVATLAPGGGHSTVFNMTSAAAAVIAGVAALAQSVAIGRWGKPIDDPIELRDMLRDPRNGTAPAPGASMGVMPDVDLIAARINKDGPQKNHAAQKRTGGTKGVGPVARVRRK